jgi:hypothetical protein
MYKHVRFVIISLAVLFIIITLISLTIPFNVRISRATDLKASKREVMEQLSNPSNWKKWYPGTDTLPYLYIDGVIKGITYGKNSTKGLQLMEITDTSVIAHNIGTGARRIKMGWNLISHADTNSVTIQWYMDFKLRWYPWEKFASLVYDKQYGTMMERGLANLKKLTEQ